MDPQDSGMMEGMMWSDGDKAHDTLGGSYFSTRGFACMPRTPPAELRAGIAHRIALVGLAAAQVRLIAHALAHLRVALPLDLGRSRLFRVRAILAQERRVLQIVIEAERQPLCATDHLRVVDRGDADVAIASFNARIAVEIVDAAADDVNID